MDNFILKNDTWLRYLPIIIYSLIVLIIVLLIIIGFLVLKKRRDKSLKSQRHKSSFAMAYADCFATSASSSLPTKREHAAVHEPDIHFSHINPSRVMNRPRPTATMSSVMTTTAPSVSKGKMIADGSRVVDFYFEYEDEYRI